MAISDIIKALPYLGIGTQDKLFSNNSRRRSVNSGRFAYYRVHSPINCCRKRKSTEKL